MILLKNDGASSTLYGGNKVRKLEFLLAEAATQRARRLVVWGDIDSHTIAATCRFGLQQNFHVDAVLYPQGDQQLAGSSLQSLAAEEPRLRIYECGNLLSTCLRARMLAIRPQAYLVPLGASTPHSTLGYVHAAIELVQQLHEGQIDLPKAIYLPFATGGTAAGLLIGLELAHAAIEVVAVQTVQSVIANRRRVETLMRRTLRLITPESAAVASRAAKRLRIVNSGEGERRFRQFSAEGRLATSIAHDLGLELEPVFSGKAFAALLRHQELERDGMLLFWNTHDQSAGRAGALEGYGGDR